MTYDDLNEVAKTVAYIVDQMGHRTGRNFDTESAAAVVLYLEYSGKVTTKEVLHVAHEARAIIEAAESVEGRVASPEQ